MRLPITFFLPLFLLALPSTRSWDPALIPEVIAQDSVDAILARYSRAAGGEALKEIRSETRRGGIVRGRSGRVPVEVVSLPQSRWRWKQTLAWGDRLAFGFDGESGWKQDSEGVTPMNPEQERDFRILFDITGPLTLQSLFSKFTLLESERREAEPVTVLRAHSPDGRETELAFDVETGLLHRVGGVVLEDYRDVNGVTRPFRLRMGDMMVVEFSEIQHDLPVDEALFHPPEAALPPTDPVIYRKLEEVKVPVAALDACVGDYQLAGRPVFSITREGEHLMFQAPGSTKFEIFPLSERDYALRFNYLEFHFLEDESGTIDRLAIGADGAQVAMRIR